MPGRSTRRVVDVAWRHGDTAARPPSGLGSQAFVHQAERRPGSAPEGAESRRARICQRCGSCLCKRPSRKSFVTKWRLALSDLLRKPPRALATLRGPNEARVAFERGDLVVRTESLEIADDAAWHHVSFARLSPFRAVLLEMTPCIDGEFAAGIVGLTPACSGRTPGSADRQWRFVREHVALSCLDLEIRRPADESACAKWSR